MTAQTHARCDNCEALIFVEPEDAEDLYDQILENGWYFIGWSGEDEDTEAHLCSKRCLAVWACVHSGVAAGVFQ